MRAIVTGGAGFIGSHLVDRLAADGHSVLALDNFSTGRPDTLAHLAGHARVRLERADVAEADRLLPLFDGADWVFHLAALADIVPSIERPLDYHRANVNGTAAVLEAARRSGVTRFLYAASSSCYGIPDQYPTPEEAPMRPQYPYALTKLLGEQCVLHWGRVYGLPVVSLRLFNVYGRRSRTSGAYGAVFGVFLAQKLQGRPFTVVGDGTQSRDFTFVSDVADAFVTAAESDVAGEVFNVGTGSPVSVNRLVALLRGDVVHVPKRPGEPDRTHADVRKIGARLGWRPKVSIEEGVRILLEHIDDWRAAPVWTPESIEVATRDWFRYLGKG
ncbi:MAG: NAD-dependent dehydratase [Candidatus Rokubacteria bacterium GWC2_70_24]|nr:MAG: NAD-dependent dehydratase [Candidatus Rokubacteria bacterium GWC2_70_24]HAM57092.1 NAD-dependent dehydratase [Candidatus Rokubacteria bacterium]